MKKRTIATVLLCASLLFAQAPSKFQPTEVQKLRLENLQLKQQIAFAAAQTAVTAYNATLEALADGCKEVSKENGWPGDVSCDMKNLTFNQPPKPEAPKPTVPPTK